MTPTYTNHPLSNLQTWKICACGSSRVNPFFSTSSADTPHRAKKTHRQISQSCKSEPSRGLSVPTRIIFHERTWKRPLRVYTHLIPTYVCQTVSDIWWALTDTQLFIHEHTYTYSSHMTHRTLVCKSSFKESAFQDQILYPGNLRISKARQGRLAPLHKS